MQPLENTHPDDQERRLLDHGIIGGEELGHAADRQSSGCLLDLMGLSLDTPVGAGCLLILLLPIFLIVLAVIAVARAVDPIILVLLTLVIGAIVLFLRSRKRPPRTPGNHDQRPYL